MQLVPDSDVTDWMAGIGITSHPRFPLKLVFSDAPDCQQSWLPTGRITDLPGFLQVAVGLATDGGQVLLYRKGGGSWYEGEDAPIGNHVIDRVLHGIGIPEAFQGALSFEAAEWRDLYLVISTFFVWGWSVGEDLYIVPKNGSCILMTSHHGELFAHFPGADARVAFVAAMAEAGLSAR